MSRAVYYVICGRVLWNRTFLIFTKPRVSESVKSKIHQLWGSSFFLEMFKIVSKFTKRKKNSGKIFCFWDNFIWKCCYKYSLLKREYLLSEVNGLRNSPKILHITERDFFNLNCFRRDQSIWQRCCCSAFGSVSALLSIYLSHGPLKPDFLHIYISTSFEVRKFKNTSVMRAIFLLEIFKIKFNFENAKKKKKKKCFLFLRELDLKMLL